MTKKFLPGRLPAIWASISALIIIAGIVLYCILGFNTIASTTRSLEVFFDATVEIEEKDDDLDKLCKDAFAAQGIEIEKQYTSKELDWDYVSETGNRSFVYEVSADTSEEALSSVAKAISDGLKDDAVLSAGVNVAVHAQTAEPFHTAAWRGAIALAVAAIVVLVYVGFRFGWASAIAGLVACLNDTLVTLSILLITRIPVYAYAPVLFAGLALVVSLVVWLAQCMKMRESFKEPEFAALSVGEAVGTCCLSSWKFIIAFIVPLAAVPVLFGVITSWGVALYMLPALLPLAVSAYTSYLLAPSVLVPLKTRFDRIKSRQKRYEGKKKKTEE